MIACKDGEPQVIFGIATTDSGIGIPWMFSTGDLGEWRKTFHELALRFIAQWSKSHPMLVNYVDARNKVSIRWLRSLGFTIHPATPYGKHGEPFHRFEMITNV